MDEPERTSETPERAPRPSVFRAPHALCAGAWALASLLQAAFWWEVFDFGLLGMMTVVSAHDVLPLAGVALLVSTVFSARARRNWVVWTCLCVCAVCLYDPSWTGAVSRVLRSEGRYRALATAALSHADHVSPYVIVDDAANPKRAAITWFAAHGDWTGVVYDPAHVTAPSEWAGWLGGSRFVHLFGPWYLASN